MSALSRSCSNSERPPGSDLPSQEDGALSEPLASGDQIRDEIPAVTVNAITAVELAEKTL